MSEIRQSVSSGVANAGIQRFYLRMLDMETTGASKLDNYQNFAKAFRVRDYAAVMASIKPNAARLKSVTEFRPRDLTDRTEIGPTPLGALIVAIQEFLADKEPEVVLANLRDAVPDYLHRARCWLTWPISWQPSPAPPRCAGPLMPSPDACAISGCSRRDERR